jgi:hypothetical protein
MPVEDTDKNIEKIGEDTYKFKLFSLEARWDRNSEWFDNVGMLMCKRASVVCVKTEIVPNFEEIKRRTIFGKQKVKRQIVNYDYELTVKGSDKDVDKLRIYAVGWIHGHFHPRYLRKK